MAEAIQDELHVGISASRTDPDARPYGFRVLWIPWNSGFRGTALRVGDLVTAVGEKAFDPARRDFDFGGYAEQQLWASAGAKDGDRVLLSVARDGRTFAIEGQVRADRIYTTAAGKRAMASPGPEAMATDGFEGAWSSWDEALTNEMAAALDVGWRRDTRQGLASLLRHAARVEALVRSYPGPYASAMKEDFDRTVEWLKGTRYDLGPDDLAYRSLGESRVQDAIDLAGRAWADHLSKAGAVELASLPEVDPVRGDRGAVTGRLAVLPEMEEISEAGHGWLWARGAGSAVFLVDQRSPAFAIVLRAVMRFRALVTPSIDERFRLVGRIGADPAMVAAGRKVYVGLTVEPVAALVGAKMFIDLARGEGATFAGEEDARTRPVVDARPDLPPDEVFRSFVTALKLGEFELWKTFYATWSCAERDGRYVYEPERAPPPGRLASEYARARGLVTTRVYDLRVARTSPVRLLVDEPGRRVEEVALVVDHVGLFEGEYRAFKDVNVDRHWRLQRVEGGPWRIASEQGI